MILYCDASSMVKLYFNEPQTDAVRQLVTEASVVVSSAVAHVETRATLAALRRARRMPQTAFIRAVQRFEEDWAAMASIDFDESIRQAAGDLAARHGLRALDAIHLASFVQVLERRTDDDVYFSSFDDRLTKAARRLR